MAGRLSIVACWLFFMVCNRHGCWSHATWDPDPADAVQQQYCALMRTATALHACHLEGLQLLAFLLLSLLLTILT